MPTSTERQSDVLDRPWRRVDDPPAALYVHVPFCTRLCPYCDFAIAKYSPRLTGPYLDALARELSNIENAEHLETVYIGGGTPSRLAPDERDRLFAMLDRFLRAPRLQEVTIECNPEGLSPASVARLRALGVTRFSLGAQSFRDATLSALGRTHDGRTARRAVECLLASGASSVNVDLIFGVPGTGLADVLRDVETLIGLGAPHISLYGLTYEPGTPLTRARDAGRVRPVAEAAEARMYEQAAAKLTAAGWRHYEISNFARPGHESRHNLTYWHGDPFHAAGLGACSYVGGRRDTRERVLHRYLRRIEQDGSALVDSERLETAARRRERLAFGLRMVQGVSVERFTEAEGVGPEAVGGEALTRLRTDGLVCDQDGRLRLTARGLLFADTVQAELI